jgi:hypothetical protein
VLGFAEIYIDQTLAHADKSQKFIPEICGAR